MYAPRAMAVRTHGKSETAVRMCSETGTMEEKGFEELAPCAKSPCLRLRRRWSMVERAK
jgi:hypothetical protein